VSGRGTTALFFSVSEIIPALPMVPFGRLVDALHEWLRPVRFFSYIGGARSILQGWEYFFHTGRR
jgi:hypothetical protein